MIEPIPMSCSLPTQLFDGIDDGFLEYEDDNNRLKIWGRLLSVNNLFPSIDLIDTEYTFGRGKTCKIVFESSDIKTSKFFPAYSSQHFQIIRDHVKNYVYIVDLSSNGTFVNGEKIGKNKQQILDNNAQIALATKSHSVYVYIDSSDNDDSLIPAAIRNKYIVSREIGRGTYGEVKLCFIRGTCERFAMKIIAKKHFIDFGPQAHVFNQNIKTECSILQALNHPCIIRIHEVFDTPEAIYIVLELVDGGELFVRVVSHGQFNEPTAKFLFRQMCIAVKYLHDHNITHRDLKPENILLSSPDTNDTLVKISDFGLSRFINEKSLMKTFCGTPNYLAPEVLASRGEGSYTNKVDVWSLGVILFICLVGYPPFSESPDSPPLNEQILKGLYTFPEAFWSEVSAQAKDLVRKMMCVDPNQRLTMAGVLAHCWLADDHDNTALVEKIMYPTVQNTKSLKRAACNDESKMDQDDTSSVNASLNANSKRFKH